MIWEPARWNHDLHTAIKKYIALRKEYQALWRQGTYAHLYAQGKVYIFARQRHEQTVIVGVNASSSAVRLELDVHRLLPNGATVHEEWGSTQHSVIEGAVRGLTIPARAGAVWVGERLATAG